MRGTCRASAGPGGNASGAGRTHSVCPVAVKKWTRARTYDSRRQHLEPRGGEVAVEGQRTRDAALRHGREADGVGKREVVVVIALEPIVQRCRFEVPGARDHQIGRLDHAASEGDRKSVV